MNKPIYTTCLKTEKLKISRSIVAAIREKKGRFLEKDAATGTWYDIGDKKAVEKTSQALREGLDVRHKTYRPEKMSRRDSDSSTSISPVMSR